MISITVSSSEKSYIKYTRMSSRIYNYVINLVVSLPCSNNTAPMKCLVMSSFVHDSQALHRAMFETDIHCKLPCCEMKQNGFADNALCACASQQRFLSLGYRQTKALHILVQKAVFQRRTYTAPNASSAHVHSLLTFDNQWREQL